MAVFERRLWAFILGQSLHGHENMMRKYLLRIFAIGALALPSFQPVFAEDAKPSTSAVSAPLSTKTIPQPWLYENSDIPVDTSWTFGKLPNGLRYAVKKNDVPAGQVAIRVRIDAGALHENDDELGYAHLLEHLSFRGSTFVPDGEAKRIWQRFGATFGSDSNAQTTATQTVYKLDLPNAKPEVLAESMKILSGMIQSPRIAEGPLNAEKAIVMAEMRESSGAAARRADAMRTHFFQGQRMENRPVIGTTQTLQAANVEKVRNFQSRWYRPENTVISAAGDVDPKQLEKLIAQNFGNWKGAGALTAQPNFGAPVATDKDVLLIEEPTLPPSGTIAYLRPWVPKNDTIVYNEQLLINALATQIINRRLEVAARDGGSFLVGQSEAEDYSRSANVTLVEFSPVSSKWDVAVRDIRAVIADAVATPPSDADIEREKKLFANALRTMVDSYRFEAASKQADDITRAVDIRETVATPQTALDVYNGLLANKLTPARLHEATKALFSAVDSKILMVLPKVAVGDQAKLATAFTSPLAAKTNIRLASGQTNFSSLPKLGAEGKASLLRKVDQFDLEQFELSNGATFQLSPNKAEAGQIRMVVRFGRGYQAVGKAKPNLLWTGSLSWPDSGIGSLRRTQIDDLTNGRRMEAAFRVDSDAFEITSTTRPEDLADQLLLIATKLEHPGWDAATVERTKALALQGIESYESSAGAVIERDFDYNLAGGDARWKSPNVASIQSLTPKSFKTFWQPLLASGPVEISLFGDFERDKAIVALEKSFGAMKRRPAGKVVLGSETIAALMPSSQPKVVSHKGPADQAAAVIAWSTSGGRASVKEGRELEILAAIFRDRLFEKFRSEQAASYSPNTINYWPEDFASGGYVVAYALVKPEDTEKFYSFADSVAADLVQNPVQADELKRAIEPIRQEIERTASGNSFWLSNLKGATRDDSRIEVLTHLLSDHMGVTPARVQQLAQRYLRKDRSWKWLVLPTKK